MFYNKFKKHQALFRNSFGILFFLIVFVMDLLYSNVFILDTKIKVPYLFFISAGLFILAKLLYKYVLSSLRTNNFNYDL